MQPVEIKDIVDYWNQSFSRYAERALQSKRIELLSIAGEGNPAVYNALRESLERLLRNLNTVYRMVLGPYVSTIDDDGRDEKSGNCLFGLLDEFGARFRMHMAPCRELLHYRVMLVDDQPEILVGEVYHAPQQAERGIFTISADEGPRHAQAVCEGAEAIRRKLDLLPRVETADELRAYALSKTRVDELPDILAKRAWPCAYDSLTLDGVRQLLGMTAA